MMHSTGYRWGTEEDTFIKVEEGLGFRVLRVQGLGTRRG
jgi:hypothetical protein